MNIDGQSFVSVFSDGVVVNKLSNVSGTSTINLGSTSIDFLANGITATNLTLSGYLNSATANVSGLITGNNINALVALTAPTATVSGALNTGSLVSTGSITTSGAVNAGVANLTNINSTAITASTLDLVSGVSASSATVLNTTTTGALLVNNNAIVSGSLKTGALLSGSYSSSGSISAAGAITGASVAAVGLVSGATLTASGQVNGASVVSTGVVSGTTLTASGAVNAASVVSSGSVSGTSLTASGAVNAASVVSTGAVSGTSLTASGAVNAGSVVSTGAISGTTLTVSGAATAGSVNATSGNITNILNVGSVISTTLLSETLNTTNNVLHALPASGTFNITDTGVGAARLTKFNVNSSNIVSQVLHTFNAGLEPVATLVGDIGSTLKRFNAGYFTNLFAENITPSAAGLSILGKAYVGTRPIMSGGFSMISEGLVSNSTTETSLIAAGAGSLTTAANSMVAGSASKSTMTGLILTSAPRTLTLRIYMGATGTILLDTITVSVNNLQATTSPFELAIDLRVVSVGTAGGIYILSKFTSGFANVLINSNKTVNTTTSNLFRITGQWSAADTNTIAVSTTFNSFNIYQP